MRVLDDCFSCELVSLVDAHGLACVAWGVWPSLILELWSASMRIPSDVAVDLLCLAMLMFLFVLDAAGPQARS